MNIVSITKYGVDSRSARFHKDMQALRFHAIPGRFYVHLDRGRLFDDMVSEFVEFDEPQEDALFVSGGEVFALSVIA